MRGLVEEVKAFESLTVDAARSGDRRTALRALIANPLVRGRSNPSELLDALLDANRKHLPRFFPDG
jgi:6-phospho-beta-glucosidase